MDFDAGAVDTEDIRVGIDQAHFLDLIKDFLDCTILGPTAELHVDRVPVPVLFRQCPPFASVFYDIKQSTKEPVI